MTPTLLAQLGWLFNAEASALEGDPYAWPPTPPEKRATPTQLEEAARLHGIADALFVRAEAAGFGADGRGTGTDAAFEDMARQAMAGAHRDD